MAAQQEHEQVLVLQTQLGMLQSQYKADVDTLNGRLHQLERERSLMGMVASSLGHFAMS